MKVNTKRIRGIGEWYSFHLFFKHKVPHPYSRAGENARSLYGDSG